jgi:hypothetical protein
MVSSMIIKIRRLHYGKRYPGMPYQDRHCKVLAVASGKPFNVLIKLREGILLIIPYGNLRED